MNQILKARSKRHLSTTELARRLGISQSSALRLEQSEQKGKITIDSLMRVAEALGYKLEYRFVSTLNDKIRRTKGVVRKRLSGKRTSSKLSQSLKSASFTEALTLSPLERLSRACQLSDLGLELHNVQRSAPRFK